MADYFDDLFADSPAIMDVPEVADLLRVKVNSVYEGLRSHRIPGFKVGKHWRILREELKDSLRHQTDEGDDPITE